LEFAVWVVQTWGDKADRRIVMDRLEDRIQYVRRGDGVGIQEEGVATICLGETTVVPVGEGRLGVGAKESALIEAASSIRDNGGAVVVGSVVKDDHLEGGDRKRRHERRQAPPQVVGVVARENNNGQLGLHATTLPHVQV
jgi:hypothetical protein